MEFEDTEINALNLQSLENICLLIVKYLCGENFDPQSFEKDESLLLALISNVKERGLDYRQFNELLLLLNQDKVGEDFFKFFFEKDNKVMLEDLKKGITKFRGFAMLCYGNFRFAYKQLVKRSKKELNTKLSPYWREPSELKEEYGNRSPKMLEIENIPRDRTWYLGHITGRKVDKQVEVSEKEQERIEKGNSPFKKEEFFEFRDRLRQIGIQIEEAQHQAFGNTEIYLTWDYMDVYFATSMRNKWEYEETSDFIKEVFNDNHLKELNLRYFDPTQSKCGNSREKGLIEGLMLRRTECTIYLAQESDTMGKDSELAATLAQSKPVIAYVPRHDPKKYSQKIRNYPLSFFKKRLLILDAEGVFEDPKCEEKLRKYDENFEERIDEFVSKMNEYRFGQPYTLWIEKDEEFKKNFEDFSKICEILAIAECHNFELRAKLLKEIHPLSMQVDLQSGVANGVLVVRSPKQCADLLYRILTNEIKFLIRHIKPGDRHEREEGYTVLEEEISGSPFRVVIGNVRLTNSFWNLFF